MSSIQLILVVPKINCKFFPLAPQRRWKGWKKLMELWVLTLLLLLASLEMIYFLVRNSQYSKVRTSLICYRCKWYYIMIKRWWFKWYISNHTGEWKTNYLACSCSYDTGDVCKEILTAQSFEETFRTCRALFIS